MRRFDIVPRTASGALTVVVQSDHMSDLDTRLVLPLMPLEKGGTPASRLNPVVMIDGAPYIVVTQHAAAIKTSQLGFSIGNLAAFRDEITTALDLLITGF